MIVVEDLCEVIGDTAKAVAVTAKIIWLDATVIDDVQSD